VQELVRAPSRGENGSGAVKALNMPIGVLDNGDESSHVFTSFDLEMDVALNWRFGEQGNDTATNYRCFRASF